MVEIRALVVIIRRSLRSRFGRFAVGMGIEGEAKGVDSSPWRKVRGRAAEF